MEGECDHYLQVCCDNDDIIDGVSETTPSVIVSSSTTPRSTTGDSKFLECGYRNPDGVGFRIINGRHNETEFGEFPWMVAILESQTMLDIETQAFICGGSLIAPNVVLTAAHCVHMKEAESLTARAGEWDTKTESETLPYQVSKLLFHIIFLVLHQFNLDPCVLGGRINLTVSNFHQITFIPY